MSLIAKGRSGHVSHTSFSTNNLTRYSQWTNNHSALRCMRRYKVMWSLFCDQDLNKCPIQMKDYKFYIILIYIYMYIDVVMAIIIRFISILFTQASSSTECPRKISFLRCFIKLSTHSCINMNGLCVVCTRANIIHVHIFWCTIYSYWCCWLMWCCISFMWYHLISFVYQCDEITHL